MIEVGQVVGVSVDGVDVRISPSGECEACGMCSEAGAGGMLMQGVADSQGALVGDTVEVLVPDGSRLRAALVGYALPVAILLVAYLAGFLLGTGVGTDPDTTGAIAAVVVTAGSLFWLRAKGRFVMSDERFRPRVRAIIRRGAPG